MVFDDSIFVTNIRRIKEKKELTQQQNIYDGDEKKKRIQMKYYPFDKTLQTLL